MATISDYCAHRFLFAIVSTLIGIAGFIVRPTLYDKRPGRGRDGLRDLHWRGDLSRMGQDDRKKNGDTPGKKAEECTRIARVANEKSTVDGENHAEYTAKSCGVRLCKMRAHSMCKVEVVYGGFWDDRIQHVTLGSGCPFWGGRSRQNRRNRTSTPAMTENPQELLRTLQFGRTSRTCFSWQWYTSFDQTTYRHDTMRCQCRALPKLFCHEIGDSAGR